MSWAAALMSALAAYVSAVRGELTPARPSPPLLEATPPEPVEPAPEALSLGAPQWATLLEAIPDPSEPRRVTAAQTNEAIRALVRRADRELGLGAPQETAVAAAVQEAGRASGAPSGARFSVVVWLDREGRVSDASIEGDASGASLWPATLERVRASLSDPIALGLDERRAGAAVRVDAQVLHVLPSGTVEPVVAGECPQLAQVGGEAQPSFFAFGGAPFLEPARGLCPLGDAGNAGALRTIVVRTTTTTGRVDDAPPPLSAFPRPAKKKALPSLSELLFGLLEPG